MRKQWLGVLFISLVLFPVLGFCFATNLRYGVNGGLKCAACTLIVGVGGQVAEVNNSTIIEEARKICAFFPSSTSICKDAFDYLDWVYGKVYRILSDKITPDVVCYGMKFCHVDPGKQCCHLFPPPVDWDGTGNQFKPFSGNDVGLNPCDTILKDLCEYLEHLLFSRTMKPLFDLDGDNFGDVKWARGTNWRGKDCRDWDMNVYPGRTPVRADVDFDANCNGIWGLNESTSIPWETTMCEPQKRGTRGLIFIGDSIGAHFHFPEVWMNPLLISKAATHNITRVILDEFDWPELGFATGYESTSHPILIERLSLSVYLRLRQRNLCNHRDYQNICRNGAASHDLVSYADNIARKYNDKPALVMIGVFGNDVCNRFPNTLDHTTPPEKFHLNIKSTLDKLSLRLPNGSHVVLLGVTNGSFLYPVMSERIHPLGALHENVKYKNVYEWYECMEISPCVGWMSSDASLRDATSKAAKTLSQVLKNLAETAKYDNFKLHYIPDPLSLAIKHWKASGGELWEIIEAVDGLHPNQKAQPYIAKAIWSSLRHRAPDSIGIQNPHNEWIQHVFGNQGGH